MKNSRKVCCLFMVMIILVMIVGGIIQDRRAKRARVIESVSKTMDAAGCKEVSSDFDPDKEESSGSDSMGELASFEEVSSSVLAAKRVDDDSKGSFTAIIGSLLHDTRYRIEEIEVDGSEAIVKVRIFYADRTNVVDMKFGYGIGGWVLNNEEEVALSLFGKD